MMFVRIDTNREDRAVTSSLSLIRKTHKFLQNEARLARRRPLIGGKRIGVSKNSLEDGFQLPYPPESFTCPKVLPP